MRYRMFFGWIKTAMIVVIVLAGAAIIVLDSVMMSGAVPAFSTANVTVAAVSLAAAALIDIFALLLLFNSYYKLRDDGIFAMMAVFGDNVAYNDVDRISVNADTHEVFISWKREGKGESSVIRLNLSEKDAKNILPELERRCAFATVDTFIPPAKKKKD